MVRRREGEKQSKGYRERERHTERDTQLQRERDVEDREKKTFFSIYQYSLINILASSQYCTVRTA